MARTLNEREYARKRNDILDAAFRLVLDKGYTRMTVQDILADVGISSGAFYHYFDAKPAVLEALLQRILDESAGSLEAITHDPALGALEKLQGFFETLGRIKIAHKADVVRLGRVWYGDENALVRQKMDDALLAQRAPMLSAIVSQGLREGVFTIAQPDQAGEIILVLLRGMANTHAKQMLTLEPNVQEVVATHAAYMAAIERCLGSPPGCLYRADTEVVKMWVEALHG